MATGVTPSGFSNFTNLASIFPTPDFAPVTPSDTNTLVYNSVPNSQCKGLYVGGAGDLIVTNSVGAPVTFTVAAGTILPIQTTKVLLASTASLIIAFF